MNQSSENPDIIVPVQKEERILFLDSLRGIALLGILLMNSMAMSQPHQFYDKMDLSQPNTGLNFYAWALEMIFFEGTMRGLFSILFGAGTVLLLSRLVKNLKGLEPADIYYRRMLWLLVFGLINAFLFLWPGDILYPYALCGLLLFPFRNLPSKKLLWIALALLVIGTYRENSDLFDAKKSISKGQAIEKIDTTKVKLTAQQKEDLGKYKGMKEKMSYAGIAKAAKEEKEKVRGKGYISLFKFYKDINMMIQSVKFYNIYWWDILVCFFLGMALFKSGYLTGKSSTGIYILVMSVGLAGGLILNYFVQKSQYNLGFDQFKFVQKWNFSFYEIRRILQTMGYLSLLILLYKIIPFRKIFSIFTPVGQMAFTNYLLQSIIAGLIFYGFAVYGTLQRYEVYYVVVAIWMFQIIFSHIWLRFFRFGPFEWLWRYLTYLNRPPMLRKKEIVTERTV